MSARPVVVIGAGGHAKVVIETLRAAGQQVTAALDADPARHGTLVHGVPIAGGDEWLDGRDAASVLLANGIGSTGKPGPRARVFDALKGKGFAFVTVVHPAAVLASDVVLEEGAQVMAGAVLQVGCRIGANAVVNTGAVVDHDCLIGRHAHVAPGAVLSGSVVVGEGAHIGTGAAVIQGVSIGAGAVVGAGAAVVADVPAQALAVGVPARARCR
ncbi:MAG: acetyltransferase [Actinomycetota bacterium]